MRRSLTVAFVATVLVAAPGPALAQAWTEPGGQFTLDFQAGWEMTSTSDTANLRIVSYAARARNKFLKCELISLGPIPGTSELDQQRANAGSEGFGVANLRNMLPEAENIQVDHVVIDGVAAVDTQFETPTYGGLYHRWRTFWLATPDGIMQHQFQCGGALPVSSQDEAEIGAVLGTLRFTTLERQ